MIQKSYRELFSHQTPYANTTIHPMLIPQTTRLPGTPDYQTPYANTTAICSSNVFNADFVNTEEVEKI